MNSVFVTDGSWFIGSHTCLLLLEKGYTVFILDSFVNSCEESINKISIILKDKGIDVEERPLSIDEVVDAHKTGNLEEIFGTGTAVVVLPISSFSYKDVSYNLSQKADFAKNLKKELLAIQYNQIEDRYDWTVKVD